MLVERRDRHDPTSLLRFYLVTELALHIIRKTPAILAVPANIRTSVAADHPIRLVWYKWELLIMPAHNGNLFGRKEFVVLVHLADPCQVMLSHFNLTPHHEMTAIIKTKPWGLQLARVLELCGYSTA